MQFPISTGLPAYSSICRSFQLSPIASTFSRPNPRCRVHSAKAFPLVTSLRSISKIEKSRSSYSVKAKVKSRARESASRLFIAARIGAQFPAYIT